MWAKRHTKFDESIDQPFLQLVSILGPTHFFTQFLHNFLTSQLPENPAGPNWCKRNSRKQREPHGPQMKKNDDFLLLYITPSFMATEQLLKHKNHFFLNLFLAFHVTHNVPKNKPSLNKNQKNISRNLLLGKQSPICPRKTRTDTNNLTFFTMKMLSLSLASKFTSGPKLWPGDELPKHYFFHSPNIRTFFHMGFTPYLQPIVPDML